MSIYTHKQKKQYNKNNKNNKYNKKQKTKILTKKISIKSKNINYKQNKLNGGNRKESFEVQSLKNFDFDKVRISKYINGNIEWGNMPGEPPMPTCSIL